MTSQETWLWARLSLVPVPCLSPLICPLLLFHSVLALPGWAPLACLSRADPVTAPLVQSQGLRTNMDSQSVLWQNTLSTSLCLRWPKDALGTHWSPFILTPTATADCGRQTAKEVQITLLLPNPCWFLLPDTFSAKIILPNYFFYIILSEPQVPPWCVWMQGKAVVSLCCSFLGRREPDLRFPGQSLKCKSHSREWYPQWRATTNLNSTPP